MKNLIYSFSIQFILFPIQLYFRSRQFSKLKSKQKYSSYKKILSKLQVNGEKTLSKSTFLCEIERKKNIFYKQLLRIIFYMVFGFITDINIKDQVQANITSIDTDANSKENQIRAANMQNKSESEATPDRGNNSLN